MPFLLTSCHKEEPDFSSDDSELVTFSPAIGDAEETKGTMVTDTTYDYSKLGPFWAKAYRKIDSSMVFNYTEVRQFTHTTGSLHSYWSTVDASGNVKEYFWKKTGSSVDQMYFYAYTNIPADSVLAFWTSADRSYEKVTYKLDKCKQASNQKDMLFASARTTGYTKEGYVGRFVTLNFKHPLAAVKFKKGNVEGWTSSDKITSIEISGVYSRRAFVNQNGAITWRGDSDDSTHYPTTVSMSNSSGLSIAGDGIIGETFFLIPQNMSSPEHNITIKASVVVGGVTYSDVSCTLSSGEWTAGHFITYTLDISTGYTVELKATISDWGEIKTGVEMDDGSILTYGDPAVDPWDAEDGGNISYSE